MIHVFNASAARPSVQWSWVTLSGTDAQDFLHRVTTVHVNMLQIGTGSPGCFLTPQGKIRAFFTLWNFAPGDYAFEFEAGASGHWKQELVAAIDQYTFAEKIVLTDITALECRWILAELSEEAKLLAALGASELKAGGTAAVDDEIRICHHGIADYGRIWLTAWGRPARLQQWLERAVPGAVPVGPDALELWRVQAMRPKVDVEITLNTIPLEVGLIDALAQSKGCYPGQEVIERITSLGAPARRLAQLAGEGSQPHAGEPIFNCAEPPVEVGQVTSVAMTPEQPGHFTVLGFVRKIHAKEGLEVRFGQNGARATIKRVAPYA
jgi:folate-binding protein YgfZ